MTDRILLERLYTLAKVQFPKANHNPQRFGAAIVNVLWRDPIRTSSLRQLISQEGLNLEISDQWPLNDFCEGSVDYLVSLGVSEKEALDFTRGHYNKSLFE